MFISAICLTISFAALCCAAALAKQQSRVALAKVGKGTRYAR